MIKTLLTSLFAVSLFASGIVGSWYFADYRSQMQQLDETEPVQATLTPELAESVNTSDDLTSSPIAGIDATNADLPTPFHGPSMSSADVFRYASMNRKTMESLRRKEEQIRQEEMRLNLLNKDIEGRKREVEGILQQSQKALANAQQLMAQIATESQELERKKTELTPDEKEDKVTAVPSAERLANIKVTAGWLEGMDTADAGETLKNLANSGKMDFALRLLSYMEPRKVASILDSLKDPTLVAELTEGFVEITRPPKSKKR